MNNAPVIPNDWPDGLTLDILSPVAYLRAQAAKLAELTNGLLVAEVRSSGGRSAVTHSLEVVAPAMRRVRLQLLVAAHQEDFPYPVTIESDCFDPPADSGEAQPFVIGQRAIETHSYEELRERVRSILRSRRTKASIQSVIALRNEKAAG